MKTTDLLQSGLLAKFPKIMGIVNVTPDSFSDGGDFYTIDKAFKHSLKLIEQGADILDIGGESTRPGAEAVSTEEEVRRVVPLVERIRESNRNIQISIDTTKYEVAKQALKSGADFINDISGLTFDPRLAELSGEYKKPIIIMHMRGTPRTMQENPAYDNVVEDVFSELADKICQAKNLGAFQVIADVGIGFGKTKEHNWELLKHHQRFEDLGVELLLGISRKSFIHKTFDIENPKNRDLETVLIHSILLKDSIDYIRVHNVAYHKRLKDIYFNLI